MSKENNYGLLRALSQEGSWSGIVFPDVADENVHNSQDGDHNSDEANSIRAELVRELLDSNVANDTTISQERLSLPKIKNSLRDGLATADKNMIQTYYWHLTQLAFFTEQRALSQYLSLLREVYNTQLRDLLVELGMTQALLGVNLLQTGYEEVALPENHTIQSLLDLLD